MNDPYRKYWLGSVSQEVQIMKSNSKKIGLYTRHSGF